MSAGANSLKSVLYALGANFGIAVAKSFAAVVTGSGAMLAEAIHSFADCGNQLLLLWGMKKAKTEPTPEFPLGHGKAIYFWSFVVAILLFSVGGLFSLYEGLHKLHAPEAVNAPWIAIGVLVFGILLEGLSMAGCVREVNKVRGGRSYWQWFRESREAELVVIFGEDLAALLGLSLALVAVALTMVTGNPMWDALGTLSIGILLIIVAIGVGIETKALLIGQSAEKPQREAIEQQLAGEEQVTELFNVITLHVGDDLMVAAKARMAHHDSPASLSMSINAIEARLKQAHPEIRWVFFEPDCRD